MKRAAVIALLFAALALAVWHARRVDPARHVRDLAYPMRCLGCTNACRLTTAELNRMVDLGQAESPPEQMRRFLCDACGQTNLIMDQTAYDEARRVQYPTRARAD
jgi:hypothetical protein